MDAAPTAPRLRGPRRLAAVAAAVLALGASAGCGSAFPTIPQQNAAVGDGVDVSLSGAVDGLSLVVVTDATGATAYLTGAVTNRTRQLRAVSIGIGAIPAEDTAPSDAGAATARLEAGGTAYIGPGAGIEVSAEDLEAKAGGVTTVFVSTPEEGAVSVQAPVVDGTLPEYAAVLAAADR